VPRSDHMLTPLDARRVAMTAVEEWMATLPGAKPAS